MILFHHSDDIESFIETYNVRRTCILRSFCLKTGLQLAVREYQFESNNKSSRTTTECFNEDDIINIYPIIKQVPPKVKNSILNKSKVANMYFYLAK